MSSLNLGPRDRLRLPIPRISLPFTVGRKAIKGSFDFELGVEKIGELEGRKGDSYK